MLLSSAFVITFIFALCLFSTHVVASSRLSNHRGAQRSVEPPNTSRVDRDYAREQFRKLHKSKRDSSHGPGGTNFSTAQMSSFDPNTFQSYPEAEAIHQTIAGNSPVETPTLDSQFAGMSLSGRNRRIAKGTIVRDTPSSSSSDQHHYALQNWDMQDLSQHGHMPNNYQDPNLQSYDSYASTWNSERARVGSSWNREESSHHTFNQSHGKNESAFTTTKKKMRGPNDLVYYGRYDKDEELEVLADFVKKRVGGESSTIKNVLQNNLTKSMFDSLTSDEPAKEQAIIASLFPEAYYSTWMAKMKYGEGEALVNVLHICTRKSMDVVRYALLQSNLDPDLARAYYYGEIGGIPQLAEHIGLIQQEKDEEEEKPEPILAKWLRNMSSERRKIIFNCLMQNTGHAYSTVVTKLNESSKNDPVIARIRTARRGEELNDAVEVIINQWNQEQEE
jgi:hypothetical protein